MLKQSARLRAQYRSVTARVPDNREGLLSGGKIVSGDPLWTRSGPYQARKSAEGQLARDKAQLESEGESERDTTADKGVISNRRSIHKTANNGL